VHGGGDVRTASSTLPDVEAVTDGLQAKEPLDAEGARLKRAKVKSKRVFGPEWVSE
jgi:hypothetical protein